MFNIDKLIKDTRQELKVLSLKYSKLNRNIDILFLKMEFIKLKLF